MKTIRNLYIDGELIITESDFHDLFVKNFDFGIYYGYNLDAFWDMISTNGVLKDTHIYWKNHETSKKNLGLSKFDSIIFFFDLLKKENIDYKFDDCFDYFLI